MHVCAITLVDSLFVHHLRCWYRNPNYKDRPAFSDIVDYLATPDESLLVWSSTDRAVSRGAAVLGGPLDEGKDLFTDLQLCYSSTDRDAVV